MDGNTVDRAALARVWAVINGKGGVGKTTVSANVAGLLARSGYRVLVIDMDPQGNLGLDLGYAGGADDDQGRALAGALLFGTPLAVLSEVRENLDVVPGGAALHDVQNALAARSDTGGRLALAAALAPIAGAYDLVLIDCPPGAAALQTAALTAARWAVVPSRADAGSRLGLEELARRFAAVLDVNPTLDLLGVVLFDVETGATRVQAAARQMVADALGAPDAVLAATVRHSSAVAQRVRDGGQLVHELDEQVRAAPAWWQVRRGEAPATSAGPRTASSVADDLHAVTAELLERLTAHENAQVTA